MIVEIFDKLVPTLSVKIKDAEKEEVYAEYAFPGDYQIIYAQSKFFLDFEPATKQSIIEITTPLGVTEMQVSARVENASQADNNYLFDWTTSVMDHARENSDLAYMLYLKQTNVEPTIVPYTETSSTLAHVDFSNYDITTLTFPDTNANPYFVTTNAGPSTVGGAITDDTFCLMDPDGYITASVYYTTETGFSFGALYQRFITIDMGSIKIEIDEECNLTFTATDGFRTVTATDSFPPTGDWRSVLVVMDGPLVRIYFRDMLVRTVLLYEDGVGLENLVLSMHSIVIEAHGVDEFFATQEVIDYVDATDFWISNKPTLIATTRSTQYMIPTNLFEACPSTYDLLLRGHSPIRNNVVSLLLPFTSATVLTGTWCYVWDALEIEYVSEYGISFEVDWKDKADKFHYPKRRAPISKSGYFGVYLPVGDIITAQFYDTNRTFRFVVPNTSSVKMTSINGGQYVVE